MPFAAIAFRCYDARCCRYADVYAPHYMRAASIIYTPYALLARYAYAMPCHFTLRLTPTFFATSLRYDAFRHYDIDYFIAIIIIFFFFA